MIRAAVLLAAGCATTSTLVADGTNVSLYTVGDPAFHHAHPAQVSEDQVRAALHKDGSLIDAQISSLAAACARELTRLGAHQQLLLKGDVELALFVEEGAIVVGRWQSGTLGTRVEYSIAAPPPAQALVIPMAQGEGVDRSRARALYDSATSHYNLAEYRESINDFKAAYRMVHDAALIFNIAQCHRMLRETEAALEMYRSYRREAPNSPNRAEVERLIQELERHR